MSTYRGAFSSDSMDVLGGKPTRDVGGARYANQTKLPKDQNATTRNYSAGGGGDSGWQTDGNPRPPAETDQPRGANHPPAARAFQSSRPRTFVPAGQPR